MRINRISIKRLLRHPLKTGIVVTFVALLLVGGYWSFVHKASDLIPSTQESNTSNLKSPANTSNSGSSQNTPLSPSPKGSSQTSYGNVSSGSAPAKPSGNFVSNHHPGANNTSTVEESVCVTTPGATCYIQLSMGDNVKKLNSQTTDSSGAAFWNWDVNNAGLSSGSWKVIAIATLNGKTTIANDLLNLEVQ